MDIDEEMKKFIEWRRAKGYATDEPQDAAHGYFGARSNTEMDNNHWNWTHRECRFQRTDSNGSLVWDIGWTWR